jgi:hypothetical protein
MDKVLKTSNPMREICVKLDHKGKQHAVDLLRAMRPYRTVPQNMIGYIYEVDDSIN